MVVVSMMAVGRGRVVRSSRRVVSRVSMVSGVSRVRARRRVGSSPDAVFLWVPKAAGSSVWSVLAAQGGAQYWSYPRARWVFPNAGLVTFGHIRYLDLVDDGVVTEGFDGRAVKFCVVRNPYSRAVSLFNYLRRFGPVPVVPPSMGFDEFAELLGEGRFEPVGRYNTLGLSQCNPQCRWIEADDGRVVADVVGRFEDLDGFMKVLRSEIGLVGELPHLNRSTFDDHRGYYRSASTRSNIERCYREDLDRFSYDF